MEDKDSRRRYDSTCIFCKVSHGHVYSIKIFETEKSLAFLDINPVNPGHTLVIPKAHFETIYDIEEDYLKDLITTTKEVAEGIKKTFGSNGLNLLQKNEKAGGQQVGHFHMQVIPREFNDGVILDLKGENITEEQLEDYGERLRKHMNISKEERGKIEVTLENIDDNIRHLEELFHENKKLIKNEEGIINGEKEQEENAGRS